MHIASMCEKGFQSTSASRRTISDSLKDIGGQKDWLYLSLERSCLLPELSPSTASGRGHCEMGNNQEGRDSQETEVILT
jgi:hypothetical protein